LFKADLPNTFEELNIKTYIGATDLYTAELIIFDKGELLEPLLGSIAIPGIFPNIAYKEYLLNDGGVVDNFPSGIAQKQYPNHHIIGVILNVFERNQDPKNLFDTLSISLEIMMRKDLIKRSKEIDIAFYEPIDCGVLDTDKQKRKKAFEQGYASGMEKFKGFSYSKDSAKITA
jgi:NTE family protein